MACTEITCCRFSQNLITPPHSISRQRLQIAGGRRGCELASGKFHNARSQQQINLQDVLSGNTVSGILRRIGLINELQR